jgi:hypothetical protein
VAPAAAPAPKSPSTSGKKAHDDTVIAAEGVRQTAITPTTPQATVNAAEIAFYRTVAKSALANGVSPSAAIRALQNLGQTGI